MGHRVFNGCGQVNYCFVVFGRLPNIEHGIANIQSVVNLCAGEAFGAVLEREIALGLIGNVKQQLCAVNGNLFNLLFAFFKHLLALCDGG